MNTHAKRSSAKRTQGKSKVRKGKARSSQPSFTKPELPLPEDERLRAEVLSKYLARVAAHDEEVLEFRSEFLGGATLSVGDAARFESQHFPPDYDQPADRECLRLQDVCNRLATKFPWSRNQAASFVLTGVTPSITVVRASRYVTTSYSFHHMRIDLSVSAWVSPKTVLNAYRASRQKILALRALGKGSLVFFDFISERIQENPTPPTWRDLMAEWNRVHSEWKYDDSRHFARDYRRILQNIVFLNLGPLGEPPF